MIGSNPTPDPNYESLPEIPEYVPYSNNKASKWAAEEIEESKKQTEQRAAILQYLEKVGEYGATYHEISRELIQDRSSAGSNISVLYTELLVNESGKYRKDPITKKQCRVVVLPKYDPENKGRHPGYEKRQLNKDQLKILKEIADRTKLPDNEIIEHCLKITLRLMNIQRDKKTERNR